MLMYLFDDKCVLFPKLLSLTSLRQNIIYEFIPEDKEIADMLPVDFLSTQWVDKSACYLPTYVPLVSGIFGLVWTTMFLMCSTGSRTLTGLQRPWRVLLPVFVFSLAMGGLCLYATIVTHYGLQELCTKLGEITGSSTCTYSVNVATLAYERRIRGVYQATRITILSAWLHTMCWLMSALLTVARVLLAVDFQLVKVSVQLRGNIDKMLEHHEKQIRTVSPDVWYKNETRSRFSSRSQSSVKVHFQKKTQESRYTDTSSLDDENIQMAGSEGDILYRSTINPPASDSALVPDERNKLDRLKALSSVPADKQFIVKLVYDLLDTIDLPDKSAYRSRVSFLGDAETDVSVTKPLIRQYGQQLLSSKTPEDHRTQRVSDPQKAEELISEIKRSLETKIKKRFNESSPSTSKKALEFESTLNITSEMKQTLEENVTSESAENITLKRELSASHMQVQDAEKDKVKKSNLKNKNVQTDDQKTKRVPSPKVQITESRTSVFPGVTYDSSTETERKDKQTQIPKKEKYD
ncbi:uncharacterized protein [Epargyreus clarus]